MVICLPVQDDAAGNVTVQAVVVLLLMKKFSFVPIVKSAVLVIGADGAK